MDLLVQILGPLIGAVVGVLGMALYQRRYAGRPDVRYASTPPAGFGAGERAVSYQNLEVTNQGAQTATDVRVVFKRPHFDLVEHQVQFDGPHTFETQPDRTTLVVPNLPPSDRLVVSFLFTPERASARNIEHDILVSVRATECLGKPRGPKQQSLGEALLIGGVSIALMIMAGGFIVQNLLGVPTLGPRVRDPVPAERPATAADDSTRENSARPDIASLVIQAPSLAQRGASVPVEIFVSNLSDDPFTGLVRVFSPSWPTDRGDSFWELVSIPGKKQVMRTWTLAIPKAAAPGRYMLYGSVSGSAFDRDTRVEARAVLEIQ